MKLSEIVSASTSAFTYVVGTSSFTLLDDKSQIVPQAQDLNSYLLLGTTYLFATGVPSFVLGHKIGGVFNGLNSKNNFTQQSLNENASFHGFNVGVALAIIIGCATVLLNEDKTDTKNISVQDNNKAVTLNF